MNFSAVRVHDDAQAAASAQAVRASAYASGQHIVFGRGRLAPHTTEGRRLLAHELAHVAQQSALVRRDGTGDEPPQPLPEVQAKYQEHLDYLAEDAATTAIPVLPAIELRARVLMQFWHDLLLPGLGDTDAVDEWVADVLAIAADEKETIEQLGDQAERYIQSEPGAFPQTWSERVRILLKPDADELALMATAAQTWKTLQDISVTVADELTMHGLPESLGVAAMLLSYRLRPSDARIDRDHVVKRFAQAALSWGLAQSAADFTHAWNGISSALVMLLASGGAKVDYAQLELFKSQQLTQVKLLPDLLRKGWLEAPQLGVFPALPDTIPVRIASSHFVHRMSSYDSFWVRAQGMFSAGMTEADGRIQALSPDERVALGAAWADELGFGAQAWKEVAKGLWDHAPEMAGDIAKFAVIQEIPVINILYDLYLAGEAAWDMFVEVPREIDAAMDLVKAATSVVDLMRTEAQLKLAQTGGLARQVFDAIAIRGTAKSAKGKLAEASASRAAHAAESAAERVGRTRTRASLLEGTRSKFGRLSAEEVAAEAEAAAQIKPRRSTEPDLYDDAIDLPNEHSWQHKRKDKPGGDIWCRFSPTGVCDTRFKPEGVEPPGAPTPAPPRAGRAEIEATQGRLEQARSAHAAAPTKVAEAEAKAARARENLDYAKAERAKASSAGDKRTAGELEAEARQALDNASRELELARQRGEQARLEGDRLDTMIERQRATAQQLDDAVRAYDDFAAAHGQLRPPGADGRLWDRHRARVKQLREQLSVLGAEAAMPLATVMERLRRGSPPKTGTPARAEALKNAEANFKESGLHDGKKPVDVAGGGELAPGDVTLDHIYAVDNIFSEPGFNLLSEKDMAEILELPKNYMPLRLGLNSSKGSLPMTEWFKTAEGSKVPMPMRKTLVDLETKARDSVRAEILRRSLL